jgi:hypothetical protein
MAFIFGMGLGAGAEGDAPALPRTAAPAGNAQKGKSKSPGSLH